MVLPCEMRLDFLTLEFLYSVDEFCITTRPCQQTFQEKLWIYF